MGRDKYFAQKEYLLWDSAFRTSAVMIPVFKKGHNSNMSEEKRFFNTKLAKVKAAWMDEILALWIVTFI